MRDALTFITTASSYVNFKWFFDQGYDETSALEVFPVGVLGRGGEGVVGMVGYISLMFV